MCHSNEYLLCTGCCHRLVELARKHDVLLLAEDIYNLIHFG